VENPERFTSFKIFGLGHWRWETGSGEGRDGGRLLGLYLETSSGGAIFSPVMTTHPGYGADNEVKEFQGGGFLRDGEHKGILEIKRNRETSGGRYARLQARIFKALQNEEFIQ
jgi:hypothetical protein